MRSMMMGRVAAEGDNVLWSWDIRYRDIKRYRLWHKLVAMHLNRD